ncbi:MAG: hypothetical protein SVR04_03695 [Spirochaetota bacterium]|nr:hypothetical protein [Spirochaetota bacterium]
MLIAIPKALREKLGEEGTNGLVDLLNSQAQNSGNSITTFVEEKFERRLSEELSKLRIEMHKNQAATIRWMFVFWVGQIGALLGILFAFFS